MHTTLDAHTHSLTARAGNSPGPGQIVVAGHIDAGYWWLMAIFYLIIGQGNWGARPSSSPTPHPNPTCLFTFNSSFFSVRIGLYLATLTVNMRNFDKEDRGKVRDWNSRLNIICFYFIFLSS
jgi:hypothetical protein